MLIHYGSIENIIMSLSSDSCSEQLCDGDLVPQNMQDTDQNQESFELIEEVEPEKQMVRSGDVFEVLDNNCWGYSSGFYL